MQADSALLSPELQATSGNHSNWGAITVEQACSVSPRDVSNRMLICYLEAALDLSLTTASTPRCFFKPGTVLHKQQA